MIFNFEEWILIVTLFSEEYCNNTMIKFCSNSYKIGFLCIFVQDLKWKELHFSQFECSRPKIVQEKEKEERSDFPILSMSPTDQRGVTVVDVPRTIARIDTYLEGFLRKISIDPMKGCSFIREQ
jgi:hypothetical protein